MQIIALIIVFLGIIILEAPPLIKQKMWGELIAFSVLLLFGMVSSFAPVLNINLPTPTAAIEAVFGPPAKFAISLFK